MEASTDAAVIARTAMQSVETGDRAGWLGLFADGAVLEDPVGQEARTGADEIAAFWDAGIANLESVRFEVAQMHVHEGEAMAVAAITIEAPGGATATYDAVVHYLVNGSGQIESLRAFWDPESVMAQLAGT